MKRILVIMLVLTMVFGMSGVVFAEEYEDWTEVEITKNINITNEGTVNPSETFEFTVGEGTGLRDGKSISAPAFDTAAFIITVGQNGTTGSYNLQLPEFTQVGVYTYPITEQGGNTAGMVYSGETNNLVVTVINNPTGDGFLRVVTIAGAEGKKVDDFTNTFNAGNLTIKKVVTGNYGDPNDEFEVTVTLEAVDGKDLKADPILAEGGTKVVNEDGTVTITYTVSDGSEYTIQNIPYNVDYTVVETGQDGYDPEYGVTYDYFAEGEMDDASIETTITNTRTIGIDTGVNLDNLPYIIVLIGALGGLVIFTIRRRLVK